MTNILKTQLQNQWATENEINFLKENFISQDPADYFYEKKNFEPKALVLFSLYEEKQSEIYGIIRNNNPEVLLEQDSHAPVLVLLEIFSPESTYNKDRICLKKKQEIQCVSSDARVESYLSQSKKDWFRTAFYSSKYNSYIEKYKLKNRAQNERDKNDIMPYLSDKATADKLFLITVNAINNYFMEATYAPTLQIDNQENVEEQLGEIDCDCEKVPDQPLICASFDTLQIPNDNIKKILYNLSFIHQSQKSEIMLNFQKVLQRYQAEHDSILANTLGEGANIQYNLGEGTGYYYMDAKNQACVYINTLILITILPSGELFYVPLYNMMQIYPFKMNDYYYTFLYVDNGPPATVGEKKSWFTRQTDTPVTADYYNFIAEKIKWYLQRFTANESDFIDGKYVGADYVSYIKKKAEEFKKAHKPYVYTYKSPKFVPPEQTPITSARLLGGKTRRRRKQGKQSKRGKQGKRGKKSKKRSRKQYKAKTV